MHSIEGITANDVWYAARSLLSQHGVASPVEGRGGSTREVLHVVCRIQQPRERWSIARVPAMNPAFAIAELIWIVTGRDDSAFLNRWNSKLPAFAGTGPTYDGAYGARLRRHFGIDQIRRVCDALSADPGSRQAVLQIWDPIQDLPDPNGSACISGYSMQYLFPAKGPQWQTRMAPKSCGAMTYSWAYPTTSFNLLISRRSLRAVFGLLLGEYCHFADSLHIYERDIVHLTHASMI